MYPKIGIRPVIDGRWGGIRESLEDQTMGLATAAKELIETLRYPDGTPVQAVISPCTIGGVAMGISSLWQGLAGGAACDAFGENGKGFTNQLMALGIVETVAIFVMAFAIVLLSKLA